MKTNDIKVGAALLVPVLTGAGSDEEIVETWVKLQLSPKTRNAYSLEGLRLLAYVKKPLKEMQIEDLANYFHHLASAEADFSVNSQMRAIAAVKSLFTFALNVGYLSSNPAAQFKLPRPKNTLAERILSPEEVITILAKEENPRNQLLIRLMYISGGRVSEVISLQWKDCRGVENGAGVVTLFGKGDSTRHIRIPFAHWAKLLESKGEAGEACHVFPSPRKKGDHLCASQAWRIVKKAALKAGVMKPVSPHWFRHAHASHALAQQANIKLVRDTLGHADISTTMKYVHIDKDQSSSEFLPI